MRGSALWLPSRMTEMYGILDSLGVLLPPSAEVARSRAPSLARVVTEATYSDFKQFQTSAKIAVPK